MRPTLHEYNLQKLSDLDCTAISDVLNFTKLTNRAPRLGDFVPTDEDDNVLEKPNASMEKYNHYNVVQSTFQLRLYESDVSKYQTAKDKVIFSGDWEVLETGFGTLTHHYLDSEYLGKSYSLTVISNGTHNIEFRDNDCGVWLSNKNHIGELQINRIEDLPREIEFKNGVI